MLYLCKDLSRSKTFGRNCFGWSAVWVPPWRTTVTNRDVNKDLTPKDQDKDKDLTPKDQDKDKDHLDLTP